MPKFQNGEVAVICHSFYPEFISRECTIISLDKTGRDDYEIEIEGANPNDYGGEIFTSKERFLKKKKPPEEEINWVEKLGLTNRETENA